MLGFTPTASMAIAGEKLGMDPWVGQSVCCGLGRDTFFLGAVALSNDVDDIAKGCHVQGLPTGSIRVAYVDWRGKHICHAYQVSLQGVHRFELPQFWDMNNRLSCGRHHVAKI
jgi:hypothetical protein